MEEDEDYEDEVDYEDVEEDVEDIQVARAAALASLQRRPPLQVPFKYDGMFFVLVAAIYLALMYFFGRKAFMSFACLLAFL